MDMAKVGGPLSVVKVCTSMLCATDRHRKIISWALEKKQSVTSSPASRPSSLAIPRAQCNNRWDTQEGTGIGVTDRGQDGDKGRVGFIGGLTRDKEMNLKALGEIILTKNRVSVSGWSPIGCEGLNTNLNIPSPLPITLCFHWFCRLLICYHWSFSC